MADDAVGHSGDVHGHNPAMYRTPITGAPVIVAGNKGAYAGSAASCVVSGPSDVAMRRAVDVSARGIPFAWDRIPRAFVDRAHDGCRN